MCLKVARKEKRRIDRMGCGMTTAYFLCRKKPCSYWLWNIICWLKSKGLSCAEGDQYWIKGD